MGPLQFLRQCYLILAGQRLLSDPWWRAYRAGLDMKSWSKVVKERG